MRLRERFKALSRKYVVRGSTRVVLLLPRLGVAVKFARLKAIHAWKVVRCFQALGQLRYYLFRDKSFGGFREHFWWGIHANLTERRFWKRTDNSVVWPTGVSLFGLANVMRLAHPTRLTDSQIQKVIASIVGDDVINEQHTFYFQCNYGRNAAGRLYLLDYGREGACKIVAKYEKKLRDALDRL